MRVEIRRVMLRENVPYPILAWYVEIRCKKEELANILQELLSGENEAEEAKWREDGLRLKVSGTYRGHKGLFLVLIRLI